MKKTIIQDMLKNLKTIATFYRKSSIAKNDLKE